ncbi:hypothetical protein [Sulfolobus spindle-shaped virus]|nr:hypothetical protein [Sulfolobus spindle-shaped virus]AZG03725.1 hypothetical protein [Sulfolobus spindle-shaped virus]AZG04014.1 hypothetical protein [Sulfolobus spindle-shaped virus]AZG04066.1 hypothetical protein [Sulfolobus spindle-shaped virus]
MLGARPDNFRASFTVQPWFKYTALSTKAWFVRNLLFIVYTMYVEYLAISFSCTNFVLSKI